MNSFGQRLAWSRERFGNTESRRSIRGLGRELFPGDARLSRNVATAWASWEADRFEPRGGADELAELYARLPGVAKAGFDALDLAQWVVSGRGGPPGAPAAIAPAIPVETQNALLVMLETGIANALAALRRGENAESVLEGLLKIAGSARQVGLAAFFAAVIALGSTRADAGQQIANPSSPGSNPGAAFDPAELAKLLSLLLGLLRRKSSPHLQEAAAA